MTNVIDLGIQIQLEKEEDFLKVKETLTRIGVASRTKNELYQSCHILHKQGKYYIVHFKELFKLDGKTSDISEKDIGRRNTIAILLQEWGLVKIVGSKTLDPVLPLNQIKVLPFKEKDKWTLVAKYNIGKRKGV